MVTLHIVEIGNYDNFNYLVIKKHKNFFDIFTKILEELFDSPPSVHLWGNEDSKKNIHECVDKHESINMEDVRIDIFYGKDKIFLTFVCDIKKRKKILDKIFEFSDMKNK